jgi:HEAT repeat protein
VPNTVEAAEIEDLLDILDSNYREAQLEAAAAFEHLSDRPELFEPVAVELVEFSSHYPRGQDGIPSPSVIYGNDDLRGTIYVADALARVAREDPTVLLSATDQLIDIVDSDRNYPRYHLFTLGSIGAIEPGLVPIDDVVEELCELLGTETHGYAGWAADTLRQIGDPSVLPELRAQYPDGTSDDATVNAFDEAIAALEPDS